MRACAQDKCHPQTIAVCQSRADGLGLKVLVGDESSFKFDKDTSGVLLQYPATDGSIHDYKVHDRQCWPLQSLRHWPAVVISLTMIAHAVLHRCQPTAT